MSAHFLQYGSPNIEVVAMLVQFFVSGKSADGPVEHLRTDWFPGVDVIRVRLQERKS